MGFTLLEVLVALTTAGLIAGAAAVLFEGGIRLQIAAEARRISWERDGVAAIAVKDAVGSAGTSVTTPFAGTPAGTRFITSCPDAFGGETSCTGALAARGALTLTLRRPGGGVEKLVVRDADGVLDYVLDAATGGTTVAEWESPTALPIAIRWIGAGSTRGTVDTLVFAILRGAP